MKITVDLQVAVSSQYVPSRFQCQRWVTSAIQGNVGDAELCIRVVENAEMQQLNKTYRHKDKPTNVLSFPSELPDDIMDEYRYLGDIVIAAEVIAAEAQEQQKSLEAHWAHMVVHGVLHLQGYDHVTDADANVMEPLEINILKQLGFANPYENTGTSTHE